MNQDTLIEYRVWPDGTVQAVADGQAYAWMSDDFRVVQASSPEQALLLANEGGFDAVQVSPDGRTVWVHAPDRLHGGPLFDGVWNGCSYLCHSTVSRG